MRLYITEKARIYITNPGFFCAQNTPVGTLTMGFHLANILLRLVLTGKMGNVRILLQIPVAFLFGQVIDILQKLIQFDEGRILNQGIALTLLGRIKLGRL